MLSYLVFTGCPFLVVAVCFVSSSFLFYLPTTIKFKFYIQWCKPSFTVLWGVLQRCYYCLQFLYAIAENMKFTVACLISCTSIPHGGDLDRIGGLQWLPCKVSSGYKYFEQHLLYPII